MKRTVQRIILIFILSTSLLACKNEQVNDVDAFPAPSPEQQKLMHKSWSEYIVTVRGGIDLTNKNDWDDLFKSEFVVKKIKPFTTNKYVITLESKTKYNVIYNSLMKLKKIESVQPNFHYQIPKPVVNKRSVLQ